MPQAVISISSVLLPKTVTPITERLNLSATTETTPKRSEVGKWVIDFGGRWETMTGTVRKELASTTTTDTTANLSPLLSQVSWGNGDYLAGTVKPSAWALATGILYKIDDRQSLFLNASRGFFMPQLNSVQIDTNDDVQSFRSRDHQTS